MVDISKIKYLNEHKPHFGTAYFVKKSDISIGDIITFDYKNEQRWAFVLDPDYEGKMHAFTLGLIPRKVLVEEVINAMFDWSEPYDLYYESLASIAKEWDSYRTFIVNEIQSPRRMGYYITPKPTKQAKETKISDPLAAWAKEMQSRFADRYTEADKQMRKRYLHLR